MPNDSYAAGSFELTLDGHKSNSYLKAVTGGQVKGSPMDEPIGSSQFHVKHLSTMTIEPIAMDIGMAHSNDVLKWIQQSWNRKYNRRNGQITYADFDLKPRFEHEFTDALITEATFPELDGASKDPAYLKVKFQPEAVTWKEAKSNDRIKGSTGTNKQKMWLANSFRLTIDGVADVEYTNKIESFTIKQKLVSHATGRDRFPTYEGVAIDFPQLSGTIAVKYADPLLKWADKYLHKGVDDPTAQKTGSLEYLSPDKKSVLFRINLYEVGLVTVGMLQNTANEASIKRMKYQLYVGRMDLDPGVGME